MPIAKAVGNRTTREPCARKLASNLKRGVDGKVPIQGNSPASYPTQNIAHGTIQSQRSSYHVPCGPKKTLHDYIPFYFAPRSPMLYSIHHGYVDGYDDGQEQVIHLRSKIETVYQAKRLFVFTDGHAIMSNSQFYDDLVDLDKIDWDIMQEKYWANTDEDPDRKRRRQAEFLVYEFFPWELITDIGVMTTKIQEKVAQIVSRSSHQPNIQVNLNCYY